METKDQTILRLQTELTIAYQLLDEARESVMTEESGTAMKGLLRTNKELAANITHLTETMSGMYTREDYLLTAVLAKRQGWNDAVSRTFPDDTEFLMPLELSEEEANQIIQSSDDYLHGRVQQSDAYVEIDGVQFDAKEVVEVDGRDGLFTIFSFNPDREDGVHLHRAVDDSHYEWVLPETLRKVVS